MLQTNSTLPRNASLTTFKTIDQKNDEIAVTIETITPEIAKKYLGLNVNFRSMKTKASDAYAKDMAAGGWDLNGEAIKFDKEGKMVDGQNRLRACVVSRTPFTTVVVRGILSPMNLDEGVRRNFAQLLYFRGETSAKNLSAATNVLFHYFKSNAFYSNAENATNAELDRVLEQNPEIRESIKVVSGITRITGRLSLNAALHYLFSLKADKEKAESFYSAIIVGANLMPEDSRFLLRNRLINTKTSKAQLTSKEMAALIIKAWNYYLEERPIKKLAWTSVGDSPEPFPEIASIK